MITLLTSVQNTEEASTALAAGADIIDIKDATRGGLAAASVQTWQDIAHVISGRTMISATMGNPPQDIQEIAHRAGQAHLAGIDIVKIGIATDDRQAIERVARQAQHIPAQVVLVYLVDQCVPLLPADTDHLMALMLDTRYKQAGKLTSIMTTGQLQDFIGQVHDRKLKAGLAGKLTAQDISDLAPLGPDIIGVRSAITEGGRDSAVSAAKIKQLILMLQYSNTPTSEEHDHAMA